MRYAYPDDINTPMSKAQRVQFAQELIMHSFLIDANPKKMPPAGYFLKLKSRNNEDWLKRVNELKPADFNDAIMASEYIEAEAKGQKAERERFSRAFKKFLIKKTDTLKQRLDKKEALKKLGQNQHEYQKI